MGQSTTKPEVFTNTGSTSVTVSQLTVTGADFQVSGVTLPFTLDAGKSQSFNVVYSPKAAGTSSWQYRGQQQRRYDRHCTTRVFRAHDMEAQNTTIALSGTATGGTGTLAPSPASVSFGNVQVNGTSSSTVVLHNTGSASVTVSQAAVTGTGFTMSGMSIPGHDRGLDRAPASR